VTFPKRAARLGVAALLVLAVAACSIHSRAHTASSAAPRRDRSVCVLFFDGLSDAVFRRAVASGLIPTIENELVRPGLMVENAVASVPSETYPNLSAMLTGLFPGHHGIPANIWLDRSLRLREAHTNIFRTYSTSDFLVPEAKTLYERLPPGSVVVTSPVARGATVYNKNLFALTASYLRNDWSFLDRKTIDDVGDAYAGADDAGSLPPLVWGHLLGPDEVAHYDGPDGVYFQAALASIDKAFSRLLKRLARRKIDDKILFVLVGDHGNASYQTAVDAQELVSRALLSYPTQADCTRGDCVLVARPKKMGPFDVGEAEIAVGAYRGAMIWLPAERAPENVPRVFKTRKKKATRKRSAPPARPLTMPPRSEFATALSRMPEIQLVVTRGASANSVLVYGPGGRSEILRVELENRPSLYAYRVLEGTGPLAYPKALADGAYRSASEWLNATALTEYPDLVVQLAEFFDSERAPDVYLSPRPGFGFKPGRAAGHGGLSRLETVVPLVFKGPGVAPGRRFTARTLDLAPTLLRYLRVPFEADELDGDDLQIENVKLVSPSAGGS